MYSADCIKHKYEKCSLLFDQIIHQEVTKSEQIIVPQLVDKKLETKNFEFEAALNELSKQIKKVSEYVHNRNVKQKN